MLRAILLGLLILIIARAFWRVIDGVIEASGGGRPAPRGRKVARSVKMQRDPVCGTFVLPGSAITYSGGDATVYFCSDRCRDEYLARGTASSSRRAR